MGGAPVDATPVLRAMAGARLRRLERLDPAETQRALLRRLLRRAARTRFGQAHGFAAIRDVADYQSRVPLRRYEDFWRDWWQPRYPVLQDVTWPGRVPYFALSSGTTSGTTKYIPVTMPMVRANRGAALDVLAWHLRHVPRSRIFGGLSFMLGGSTALERVASGVRQGDLSGIAAAEVPRFLAAWSWPPRDLALVADWERKLDLLAARTPAAAVRMLSGTPSWVLMLLEKLAARQGMPPLPGLELLVHGGVAWAPYRERIAPFLPPGCATREVYPASEGFCAIADRGEGEGLRLAVDRGVFWEFVPLAELDAPKPTRHWAATIETGVDYAVIVTSCAGLWSYVLGDTVRFVDRAPPRLLVTGRTSYSLSAFGEHLSGEEIERALLTAAGMLGIGIAEYTVGPVFGAVRGHHRWLVEPAAAADPALAPRLAAALDAALTAANDDYAVHRRGGQMDAPEVVLLPPGAFAAWMRAQGKLGGQHKVPRVLADPARFAAADRGLRS
ncbi:GH3 family domain-containing protein [Paracraurococcus lichenis]|uniref:GH3 auxin-responsive promoter family protein n=1 Tax=Paracraurococcus lichenis TaxID=3064888 RepID=A0ABT9E575_9PROT|nr:GH3 auxin-responsive promoter family protein [Paracraurococcus sp. LOR1-02]MDO9711313.1 GH3 auxin-responsive promoter family protein [Paracraurococcus sp. LOR1-02]